MDLDQRLLLPDEAATGRLAARIAAVARAGDVILLGGGYGVGKTAFARAFLRAVTGDPGLVVPSPSFTLVQAYPLPQGGDVWHYDLWRIGGPEELAELGWEEVPRGIALVEWPDRLGPLAPPEALRLDLAPVPGRPESRTVTLSGWPDRIAGLAP
ncbi:MAG: tRNA (adenosine(37)-N6)-threonylcarbamoyltransferase complex ATPase subunit type 1 TsaE [Acetobacteraceae bacterium]